MRATLAAASHGSRVSDQLDGDQPEFTHKSSQNQRPKNKAGAELRHRCRNPRCRTKLPAAVENARKAFCCRGCYESFYRNRCRVCERDISADPVSGERRNLTASRRKFCGRKCRAEAHQFPHVYAWDGPQPPKATAGLRSAHSTGLKFGLAGNPPSAPGLRGWWWGGDGDRDHSLYDRDGLTIARVVLEGGGRYHLRTPIAIPRQAWAHLEEAKRGAESFALMAMPVDPKLAARIRRDNETPHPMGPALNRAPTASDATPSGWRPIGNGIDAPDIPSFLRRRAP
jgi:hypothetical protein